MNDRDVRDRAQFRHVTVLLAPVMILKMIVHAGSILPLLISFYPAE